MEAVTPEDMARFGTLGVTRLPDRPDRTLESQGVRETWLAGRRVYPVP